MGRTSDARERLIDATIDLVWQHSYGGVGVDAICVRAGVKKGSFYHFFDSKDALVVAALDAQWESRRADFDRIFSPTAPPLERLAGYFAHVHERQSEVKKKYGRVLGCLHNAVGSECIQTAPAIAAKVQEVNGYYKKYFENAIRDAQSVGLLRRGDPAALARTLYAYCIGELGQARLQDDPKILRRLPEAGFAILGLVGSAGAPAMGA